MVWHTNPFGGRSRNYGQKSHLVVPNNHAFGDNPCPLPPTRVGKSHYGTIQNTTQKHKITLAAAWVQIMVNSNILWYWVAITIVTGFFPFSVEGLGGC